MKKKSASIRALLIVAIIGVLSFVAMQTLNKEINPDLSIQVDIAEIGQRVLQAVIDFVLGLINPERRGFL